MIGSLFAIVDEAKNLGSYPVANLAFVALMNAALDREKELKIEWESEEESPSGDNFYDILRISDGLRSACIPAPLLKYPKQWLKIATVVPSIEHNRKLNTSVNTNLLNSRLKNLADKILQIEPRIQILASEFLEDGECFLCPFFSTGYNKGAIHCTVHPFGYPSKSGYCPDFEPHHGVDEAIASLIRAKEEEDLEAESRKEVELRRKERRLQRAKEQLPLEEAILRKYEDLEKLFQKKPTFIIDHLPKKVWSNFNASWKGSPPSNGKPKDEPVIGRFIKGKSKASLHGHIVVSQWTGICTYVRILHDIPELKDLKNGFGHYIPLLLLESDQRLDESSREEDFIPRFTKKQILDAIEARWQKNKVFVEDTLVETRQKIAEAKAIIQAADL